MFRTKSKSVRRSVSCAGLIGAGAFVTSVSTVLGFLGELHWVLDLFAHFRVQYVLALSVCAVGFCVLRAWPNVALTSAFLVLNAWTIAPYYVPAAEPVTTPGPLRALYFNVHGSNTRYAETVAHLLRSDADVIVLLEVNHAWMRQLAPLQNAYPHVVENAQPGNFGIALFSRLPFAQALVIDREASAPAIVADIETAYGALRIVGLHPVPPINTTYALERDRQLLTIPALAAGQTTLVLGDLNATPWSAAFRRLVGESRLSDCALGRGLRPSWPTSLWPLMIPIDHCLKTPGIVVTEMLRLPHLGSDHFGSVVDFGLVESDAGD